MKKTMIAALLLVAAGLWAGCGGGANNVAGNTGNAPTNGAHTHGHGDEHVGEHHALGDIDLGGGVKASVTQIGDPKGGGELPFEIKVTKDGKGIKVPGMEGFIGDESGKELCAVNAANWVEEENGYDLHGECPKTLPAKMWFWLRGKLDGKDVKGKVAVVIE